MNVEFWIECFKQYYITVMASGLFLFFICFNRMVSKRLFKSFICAAISILLLVVFENGELYAQSYPAMREFRVFCSAMGYSLRAAVAFFITQVPTRSWVNKWKRINGIPMLINVLIAFSAFFTDIAYGYNEEYDFVRGPLGYIPFYVGVFYVAEIILFGVMRFRKREYQEGGVLIGDFLIILVALIFETTVTNCGLLAGTEILSLVFYYVYFLVRKYSHDQLTDAYLREKFFMDAELSYRKTAVVSLDLNGFKKINDTKGHIAGDDALVTFADVVMGRLTRDARLYRIGGDEFAILYHDAERKDVIDLLEKIRAELVKQKISFSAGYSFFENVNGFKQAFAVADSLMYEEKRRYHAKIKEE